MNFDLVKEMQKADQIKAILNAAGYTKSAIVGGALRVLALGGSTQDVDIAIICEGAWDYRNLRADMEILIRPLYHDIHLVHDTCGYTGTQGFLGDWRTGNVNIIAYDRWEYENITTLVSRFDLNINQWTLDEDGLLQNRYFNREDGVVRINPERDACSRAGRLAERIQRFKEDLPSLNWSGVHV